MPISVSVNLGISARVQLEYATIDTIIKLFSTTKVFIHQIGCGPIEYDEHTDCFDLGILTLLTGLKNEEAFKKKASIIAELRRDNDVVCLRRKKKYVQLQYDNEYNRHIFDDDNASKYKKFDANVLSFDFFSLITNVDANFYTDTSVSYEAGSSVDNFTTKIQECIAFFTQSGIHEDQLVIANHSECRM